VVGVVIAFGFVWYGAEALLARAAGWHLSAASSAIWLLRDLVLPVIWFAGWAGNSFQWRGTSVRIAESEQSA
jgi:ceramide glucosyltransferase